jgi:hypothetical protein
MLLSLLSVVALADPVRHAVIVGANDGGGVLQPLKYAETDAQSLGSLLVELGGFDDSLVTVLYAPTADQLREALAAHAAIAQQYPDDLFVFYYSGHADANGLRLGQDVYYFDTLKHDLRAIDSDVRVGVLDACRSGAITRLKGAGVTASMFGQEGTAAEGEAWLTASSADELAQESDELRGGFFTHYLVSGLRGAADTGDGIVDLDEAYRYTFDRVVARTGGTDGGAQHPVFDYDIAGSGGVGLTDLRNASALLVLPADTIGLIAVQRLPDHVQIAEVGKLAGQELKIAVPEGKYLVRRRDGDALYDVTVGVRDGAIVRVEDWGAARPELATGRGDAVSDLERLVQSSLDYERRLNLSHSPVVAGTASLAMPGAGQFYDKHYVKGAAYFGATAILMSGFVVAPKDNLDPRVWPVMGLAVWGASVADAVYNVHRAEERRPYTGWTLAYGGSFGAGRWPFHQGLSAEVIPITGLSLGLDRVGYTTWGAGGYDWSLGSRLMVAADQKRARLGAFAAFGLRYGHDPNLRYTEFRAVVGGGVDVRYYVVPRYFVDVDARVEYGGEDVAAVAGLGAGVHIGR